MGRASRSGRSTAEPTPSGSRLRCDGGNKLGDLASVKQSQVTLDEFAREWWERYAPPSWHARKARVGEPTNRETVALLQAIREAVIGERISSNPTGKR